MTVDNCRGCGKVIVKRQGNFFCPACVEDQADDYRKIRDYLITCPAATVLDIHREVGVPLKRIQELLLDQRVKYL